jgi:hypothetical protein
MPPKAFFDEEPDGWIPPAEDCEWFIAKALMAQFTKFGNGLLVTPEAAREMARRIAVRIAENDE